MSSAEEQLRARGPQDDFITHPLAKFSHWDPVVARQHTPFAVEAVEERFPAQFRFGRRNRVEVPRKGDILSDVTLEVRLPAITNAAGQPVTDAWWADRLGYVLLRRVRLLVDDVAVDDQERLWYDLADRLFCPAPHAAGLADMLGGGETWTVNEQRVAYVPLKLTCCKAHHERRAGLPITAMHLATIAMDVEAEAFAACVRGPGAGSCVEPPEIDVRVLFDSVYLEADEKQQLLAEPVVVQIRAQQDMDALNYVESDERIFPTPTVKVDLSELNHPVAFLAWVAYADPPLADEPFRYVPTEHFREVALSFDNSDRFQPRPGAHFALQQRFGFFGNCPGSSDGVMAYSFALDAAERQPSGAVTFAALQTPFMRVTLSPEAPPRAKVKVFAEYVNWLVCARGRATLRLA